LGRQRLPWAIAQRYNTREKESQMAFTLPELPWAKDALAPTISAETIDYHYGKHHKAYVDNLNKFAAGTKYESMSLEEVIKASVGQASEKKIFNNSAQIWNHTFFWHSLAPKAGGNPTGAIAAAIDKSFGNFADFKAKFSEAAAVVDDGLADVLRDRFDVAQQLIDRFAR